MKSMLGRFGFVNRVARESMREKVFQVWTNLPTPGTKMPLSLIFAIHIIGSTIHHRGYKND